MKPMEDLFNNKERQTLSDNNKRLELCYRKNDEKYGFNVIYQATFTGFFIGLDYEWPEAPEDGNYLKSSMITGYQFKKFNYGSVGNQTEHTVFLLVFTYRDKFYTNFVIFNKDASVRQADLMAFNSKEDMLKVADNQLWLEFSNEVNRFLKDL
ncbi:MAG: hypothetical protein HUJ13_03555 [Hydrogenovibrio crunogenus]|nr:hypothetical protein [Hydrogenovibrio crunogenus]